MFRPDADQKILAGRQNLLRMALMAHLSGDDEFIMGIEPELRKPILGIYTALDDLAGLVRQTGQELLQSKLTRIVDELVTDGWSETAHNLILQDYKDIPVSARTFLTDEYFAGKKIALRFLSYRQRSEKEIRNKLKSKRISIGNVDKIITTLSKLNFINDEQFAKLFLESFLIKKPMGRRLISMKLLEKGIKKDITEKVLTENYKEEDELVKCNELLNKYTKKVKAKNEIEKKRKCYQYLLSRGFENELVKEIISYHFMQ